MRLEWQGTREVGAAKVTTFIAVEFEGASKLDAMASTGYLRDVQEALGVADLEPEPEGAKGTGQPLPIGRLTPTELTEGVNGSG